MKVGNKDKQVAVVPANAVMDKVLSYRLEQAHANAKLLLHGRGYHHSTVIRDATRLPHVITANGNAIISCVNAKFGETSLYFDGTNSFLSTPTSADWNVVASNVDSWTVESFVKHAGLGSAENYIAQYQDATHNWGFAKDSNDKLQFYANNGATVINCITVAGVIVDGNQHHVVMCKVADKYGIYLDGVQVAYLQDTDTVTVTGSLYVGQTGAAGSYMDGYMQEVRIRNDNPYSAAPNVGLTDTISVPTAAFVGDDPVESVSVIGADTDFYTQDVALLTFDSNTLADGRATLDMSPQNLSPAHTNITFPATGKFANCMYSNGSDSCLYVADNNVFDMFQYADSNYTIDFFLEVHSMPSSPVFVFTQYEDSNNFYGMEIVERGVGESCELYFAGKSASVVKWEIDTYKRKQLHFGSIYHVAVVKKGNMLAIYVDGKQEAYVVDATTDTFAGFFCLGGIYTGSVIQSANVSISQFRMNRSNRFSADPTAQINDEIEVPGQVSALDGDMDELYDINMVLVNGYPGSVTSVMNINGDTGSNYGEQYVRGVGAVLSALRQVAVSVLSLSVLSALGLVARQRTVLSVKSGYNRVGISKCVEGIVGTTIGAIQVTGVVWGNTIDVVRSLLVLASQVNGIGQGSLIEVYKKTQEI